MNFKRLSTLGLLSMLLFLGSCSKEQIGQTPTVEASRYSRGSISMQLNASREEFEEINISEAKAVTFELGTKGSLTSPKFKELTDGTKLLCIVRSSNPAQPINYIQAVWKRDGNRYYIRQSDATYPFEFTAGQDLGTLYMMVVAGGEWDATTKQLKFSNRIAPITTVDGKETATLDVPYFSDWQELDIENSTPTALKVRLKNYVKGTNETPVFTLKPQGMLLRMRVENEMEDPSNAGTFRHIKLNKIYIRSTAYAGNGYYNLSESEVRAGVSKTAGVRNEQLLPWTFNDTNNLKMTELAMPGGALDLPGDATATVRGSVRDLKDYPNSPWVLVWVKPTGQTVNQISDSNGTFGVRTEIFADAEDVRSNTVYSNTPGVDAQEAAGKIVVPSMKALPAYASRKLAVKNNADASFTNGGAYSLTINLQRKPMGFDRLSEYEVANGGAAFTDANYSNVGYFSQAETVNPITLTQGGKWEYASFGTLAAFLGRTGGVSEYGITTRDAGSIYPNIFGGGGNYQKNKTIGRFNIAFTARTQGGNFEEIQTMMFYPGKAAWGYSGDGTAAYTAIVRYQYDGVRNGVPTMKMTQRYLGTYSIWAAQFQESTSPDRYVDLMKEDFKRIADAGNAFWDDELLKKDDIVRYFPLLGYKLHDGTLKEKGIQGALLLKQGVSTNADGYGLFSRTFLKHTPGGDINHPDVGGSQYPLRLVRTSLSYK